MTIETTVAKAISLAAVSALALGGCASATLDGPVNPLGYADPVVVRPAPDSPDAVPLATGLNDVGYDLFHYVATTEDGDVVLSPLSIGLAFGMLDLGATGEVKDALQQLFAYPVDGDARWSAFNTLDQGIVSEPGPQPTPTPDEFGRAEPPLPIIRIANRMFRDSDFTTVEGYAEALMRWFGAGSEPLQIQQDPEAARVYINDWVSGKTNGLIPKLIPAGSITPETVMVLVNPIYLKAPWREPFEVHATEDDNFTLLDGSVVTVPLMHNGMFETLAAFGDGYTAVDIPYTGDLTMTVILPDTGRYDEIEAALGSDFVAGVDATMGSVDADLYLPRFESETSFNLRMAIEDGLGVTGLFGVPDLLGIGPDIQVDDAVHAAKIIVNEEGTEAAAATAIMVAGAAPGPEPVIVPIRIDRPFLYIIRDHTTGAVLFVGRVLDPSA